MAWHAGAAHSACLDKSGAVLAWRSADPGMHVQEVGGALAGKRAVHISAGQHHILHASLPQGTALLQLWAQGQRAPPLPQQK